MVCNIGRIHIYCIENKALHILLFLNKIPYPCARSLPPLNRGFDFIFPPYPALTHRAIELSPPGLLNFRSPVKVSPPPYHAPLGRNSIHPTFKIQHPTSPRGIATHRATRFTGSFTFCDRYEWLRLRLRLRLHRLAIDMPPVSTGSGFGGYCRIFPPPYHAPRHSSHSTSNIQLPTFNFQHSTSNIQNPTSNFPSFFPNFSC